MRSDFKYKNIGYLYNNSKIKSIAHSYSPEKSDFDIEIIALDTILKKENGEPYFKFSKSLNNKKNKYKIEAFNLYRAETILKNDSIPKSFMDPIPIKNNFGNEVYVLEKLEKDIKIHFTKKNYQIIDYNLIDDLDRNGLETKKIFLNFSNSQLIDNAIHFPYFTKALSNQSMYIAFEDFSNVRLVYGRTTEGKEKSKQFTSSIYHFFKLNEKPTVFIDNEVYKMEISIYKNPINIVFCFIILLFSLNLFFLLGHNKITEIKYWIVFLLLSLKLIIAYSLAFNYPYFYNLFVSSLIIVPLLNLLYLFYIRKLNGITITTKVSSIISIGIGSILICLSVWKFYQFVSYYDNLNLIKWKLNFGFNPIEDFLKSLEEYYLHIPLLVFIIFTLLIAVSKISFLKNRNLALKKAVLIILYQLCI